MSPRLGVALVILVVAAGFRTSAKTTQGNKTPPESKQQTPATESNPDSIETHVEKYLRDVYAWGPSFEVKVGPTKLSPIPDLLEVPVSISMGGQSDNAIVYVSKDGKFIIRGNLADMSVDPLEEIRSKLHVGDSPSLGSDNAKVTLIEFADFECPSCRELDRILRDFLPSHPDVRLVFKNFPLTQIHPWAMTAAIAAQCTYQQDKAKFWQIHDAIFDDQDVISPSSVYDKMMDLATQLNLNLDTFQTCMASAEATAQVKETMEEGRTLDITGTPTTFVNGRRVVGPDKSNLDQFIQFEVK
jgi:protein-disulfide isomerase